MGYNIKLNSICKSFSQYNPLQKAAVLYPTEIFTYNEYMYKHSGIQKHEVHNYKW